MARNQSRGFTLVEILVVLIITGFIVAILLQSLHQVFRLQTHFGREIFRTQHGAMYADWFRQSIQGLIPGYEGGKQKFRGESRRLTGLSLAPLGLENGTLALFTWRLEFDSRSGATSLFYGEAGDKQALSILTWQGNVGRFIYVDSENQKHDNWPPFLGKWSQLPSAIYLESGTTDQLQLLIAAPRGATSPQLSRTEVDAL